MLCSQEAIDLPRPPGMFLLENVISEEDEGHLLTYAYSCPWSNDLNRRTQQYGHKFCYDDYKLRAAPPIPDQYSFLQLLLTSIPGSKYRFCNTVQTRH